MNVSNTSLYTKHPNITQSGKIAVQYIRDFIGKLMLELLAAAYITTSITQNI